MFHAESWSLRALAAMIVAAPFVATAACGSDEEAVIGPGVDASNADVSHADAQHEDSASSDTGIKDGGSTKDAKETGSPFDAAGVLPPGLASCGACVQNTCAPELAACAGDPTCVDLLKCGFNPSCLSLGITPCLASCISDAGLNPLQAFKVTALLASVASSCGTCVSDCTGDASLPIP